MRQSLHRRRLGYNVAAGRNIARGHGNLDLLDDAGMGLVLLFWGITILERSQCRVASSGERGVDE